MKESKKHIAEYEFSIGLRVTHWIRAICITILIISGFYLAYVFVSPTITSEPTNFMNAKWRAVHQIVGFILIGCFIFKVYLFFFDRQSKIERVSVRDFLSPKTWIAQIKYYLFLGKHPHLHGTYNPLQFIAYIMFYIILFVVCLTGLVLYAHVYHNGLGGLIYEPMRVVESWMGGLANVRLIHHISMWAIMVFVVAHVYMAVFNAIRGKDGAIDAIISGYKFPKEQ
ncbi:Ni/Fe-hydrogenase, b-type cytochrome subunit [Campylobacter fetus]|uniref:Ni/Fe-hydrogenase, b-type cytochrome subunit n=1 Tax=Campylobacter fetus TaxID=196 RepID=UPI00073A952A|nr:Ni/Fe-hydrogenase, b-type cytochrome subunit [Campylobacter fetus]ALV64951.1 [NiFe] hydrogenase, cytochrome b subunit [Campylobacter fetus subsp. testudinum Sp3]MPB71630.1 Ni/Fe-hydrogenase, b-type cytochrome subunit [Campylobacter fetus]MPB77387.1 Ni/Fe-hydrogenase, b-type cytochrome subunit [Campylobacter fetus]OCR87441.1 Ni/Fe hydrogenase [Campylobacter fetus subsp. testudinum]OCS04551.1 Ni/Fe hydrogenase [Campylobacter fetus subsp. testudinum]